jgi:hypothetical protein
MFKGLFQVTRFDAVRKGLVDSKILGHFDGFRKGDRLLFEEGRF